MSDQKLNMDEVKGAEEPQGNLQRSPWVKPEVREMAAGSAEFGFTFVFDIEGGS